MVSVDYAFANIDNKETFESIMFDGLSPSQKTKIRALIEIVYPLYNSRVLETGENIFQHVLGTALNLAQLHQNYLIRAASLLYLMQPESKLEREIADTFGAETLELAKKVSRIHRLRPVARELLKPVVFEGKQKTLAAPRLQRLDNSVLHKILLASAEDFRAILIRLASRTQTMRYLARAEDTAVKYGFAVETMELYAPLANRLGLWQFKWELEDYSFRVLEPQLYRKIASQLNERRVERERFLENAVTELKEKLDRAHIACEMTGRPKHLYSIYRKLCRKGIDFDHVTALYDIRAIRVLVNTLDDCYKTLDIVHSYQDPIPEEFDDYIQNPKKNGYQSIHTAVMCPDGKALEIQIRTFDMHEHAEQGVAAHWCYKEELAPKNQDDRIHLLRQLLRWQEEMLHNKIDDDEATPDLSEALKLAGFDQIIYVLTPQGDVIDLPKGATPVDFAYQLHTNLGHRCRGAKVDGNIVPLNYPLKTLQQVEILASKQETGPSRDWLNPELGFLKTNHGKAKVRQWFNRQEQQRNLLQGRAIVYREMQREGVTGINLDQLAQKLGCNQANDLFLAIRRPEFSIRALQNVLRQASQSKDFFDQPEVETTIPTDLPKHRQTVSPSKADILIVGMDNMMTHLANCCKPIPPDSIIGFVAQGKGVSIHRTNCRSFSYISKKYPERVIQADWDGHNQGVFLVDAEIEANDRKGLLKDVVETISKQQVNIIGINTSKHHANNLATVHTSLEVPNMSTFDKTMSALLKLDGIRNAKRL